MMVRVQPRSFTVVVGPAFICTMSLSDREQQLTSLRPQWQLYLFAHVVYLIASLRYVVCLFKRLP
jgi:hypothetical protein